MNYYIPSRLTEILEMQFGTLDGVVPIQKNCFARFQGYNKIITLLFEIGRESETTPIRLNRQVGYLMKERVKKRPPFPVV